jgi:cell division septum initiation protein DivIVA
MFRRADVIDCGGPGEVGPAPDDVPAPAGPVDSPRPLDVPNLSGDLADLFGREPLFRVRGRGYDRLQVDNYVSWAEAELRAAQRQVETLLTRFGQCSAELELARREVERAPRSGGAGPVGERVHEILRLAADEAAEMVEAAAEEAEQILTEAKLEAEARLHKAQHIREAAHAAGDQLRELARADRAEAAATLELARREAEELLRSAAAERERQASAAAARLAAVQEEVDDLRLQRDQARQSLRRLTDQIGEALQSVVVTTVPDDLVAVPAGRAPARS